MYATTHHAKRANCRTPNLVRAASPVGGERGKNSQKSGHVVRPSWEPAQTWTAPDARAKEGESEEKGAWSELEPRSGKKYHTQRLRHTGGRLSELVSPVCT